MTDTEMRRLGDVIHANDPTRPVSYDGEMDLGAETICLHYPMTILTANGETSTSGQSM